jgi:acetylornithine deacetylase
VAVDAELTKTLLRELVAIDSVNPALVPGARGEAAAAEFLREKLKHQGIAAELREAAPGRPNVVALLGREAAKDTRGGKVHVGLALLAHIDTVGASDMKDPFTPRECEGKLYGRGALDIKSGVAAMCAAIIAVAKAKTPLAKPLLIAAVVDEECNSIGTEALLREFSADAAIVLEPTDLKLCIVHKGYAWFEIATHGRAAHGSLREEGRDAICMMGRVLNLLDALDKSLATREPHPRLGHASLHASLIRGGQELSSYPAECCLELERRTLPGESVEQIEADLRGMLEGLRLRDPEFRASVRRTGFRPPYEISSDAPLVQRASDAIRSVTGSVELTGMAAWTDTALLRAAGIPGVVFGPRGRGLHGAEEYVELDSVVATADVLERLILDFGARANSNFFSEKS